MSDKVDLELLPAFLEDSHDMLQEWEAASLALARSQTMESFESMYRCAHNLKGGSGLVGLNELTQFLHLIEDYLSSIRPRLGSWSAEELQLLLELEKKLREWTQQLEDEPEFVPPYMANLKSVEQWLKSTGRANSNANGSLATQTSREQKSRSEETLRISAAKLDEIIKLVGELLLSQSVVFNEVRTNESLRPEIKVAAASATKLTQELHEAALSIRMFPLHSLFQRLERVCREVSNELGKPVEFRKAGSEVTLDKLVIEGISDALIHIVRNCIGHGIEELHNRQLLGKPVTGLLTIEASPEAHGVLIKISDDGNGIDPEKVAEKAITKGILTRDQAEKMSDQEKIEIIFVPGFSTAERITDISGRGVGMDVVKASVESLGGEIKIITQPGQGTTFEVHLPTNLSIIDALVVKVGDSQFAVPNQDLEEIINLLDFRLESAGIEDNMINLRGEVVPIKHLRQLLEKDSTSVPVESKIKEPCLVIQVGDEKLAYTVDDIISQQKIFVRPLNSTLATVPYISGSTVLSDGAPTMVLNMNEVVRKSLAER